MSDADTLDIVYFGKLPSRGDFVRSAGHATLIEHLDQWQSQAMERLVGDPRWKLRYDAAPTVPFAIFGTNGHAALAGHWRPSQDSSGRRFPFVVVCSMPVQRPDDFLKVAPVALTRLWARLERASGVAHAATDLSHAQATLSAGVRFDVSERAAQAHVAEFMESQTLGGLEQMLFAAGHRLNVRQAVLALGLLLQPILVQGPHRLKKALCLPLPKDPVPAAAVASFWLSLVLPFFQRHAAEVGLYWASHEGRTHLVMGFAGASASVMATVMDGHTLSQEAVHLHASAWVEDEANQDVGLRKLSNYLRDPSLSLSQACATYQEVFLGS